jgi:hypothetical protein
MATYCVTYPNGDAPDYCDTYDEAVTIVEAQWEDAEIGHDGDLNDGGDRTLCWADEESSVNDSGAKSVACIRRMD